MDIGTTNTSAIICASVDTNTYNDAEVECIIFLAITVSSNNGKSESDNIYPKCL